MQKLDLKNIYEWPITTRILIILLICAIVFYVGWMWDLSGVKRKLRGNRQIEADLKQQVTSILNKENAIKTELTKLSSLETSLLVWQKKLITYPQIPELLNTILKSGANNQLQFSLFAPGEKTKEDLYMRIPIKIIAMGSYHQLASFISQVANLPWIVEIDNFTIGKELKEVGVDVKLNNPNALLMSLSLSIYYLPEMKLP